jgi:tRNA pseudouridine38-40 synthase
MRRIKLTIEYDGGAFYGFQRQDNLPTVQGEIEAAILKLTGETVTLQTAGRTDRGVHAKGMVSHFDTSSKLKLYNFRDGINTLTPRSISIVKAEAVPDTFQARFSCTGRRYEYLIFNRRSPSPIWENRAAHIKKKLDIKLMREAAAQLVGTHNFSSFRSSECQAKSPITTVRKIEVRKRGELIMVKVDGISFLHNMVRIIVGLLVDIGLGKRPLSDVQTLLTTHDRRASAATMPACGLYFMKAEYGNTPLPAKPTSID